MVGWLSGCYVSYPADVVTILADVMVEYAHTESVLHKFNCWSMSSRFCANMALHCLAALVAIHSKTYKL